MKLTLAGENKHAVMVNVSGVSLQGDLFIPEHAAGIVVFVHGSGSSRFSSRNQLVARLLNQAGLATLLFDLLTDQEHVEDERTTAYRFDIPMLGRRTTAVVDWIGDQSALRQLALGLFGASTGGAAALVAAARRPNRVRAVVCRGGRPDLAVHDLGQVTCPTLFVVGEHDEEILDMNRWAAQQLRCPWQLKIIPCATHLFEEAGKLEQVAALACEWFIAHLAKVKRGEGQVTGAPLSA